MRSRGFKIATLCGMLLTACVAASSPEIDWSGCESELDSTTSAASDATRASAEVRKQFEKLEKCRRDPDWSLDRCEGEVRSYRKAVADWENQMGELDSQIHDVQDACRFGFTVNRLTSLEASQQRLCAAYKRSAEYIPVTALIAKCRADTSGNGVRLPDDWCARCLATR